MCPYPLQEWETAPALLSTCGFPRPAAAHRVRRPSPPDNLHWTDAHARPFATNGSIRAVVPDAARESALRYGRPGLRRKHCANRRVLSMLALRRSSVLSFYKLITQLYKQ